MDTRKSAANLTIAERDSFLEAIIRLKHKPAPNGPASVSVYDQFVALHGAVFAITAPGLPPGETVNFGHWNIGFCPWHRQYLREFEKALQAVVPGVTIPYWDWSDHVGAVNKVFVGEFLGSNRIGEPKPVTDSVLRNPVPPAERPSWWPAGAKGYPIHPLLKERFGTVLARGSSNSSWPPTAAGINQLEQLVIEQPDAHPLWYFWDALESGYPQVISLTHNSGHNFIGGHMSGANSPNDPLFWLHHSNCDRLWANWQEMRLTTVQNSTYPDHWPPASEASPFDGKVAPLGHRINDAMWPWVGTTQGYDVNMDAAIKPMLPNFSNVPPVTVNQVLNTQTIDAVGYRYAPPVLI
jgi:tyrosinase